MRFRLERLTSGISLAALAAFTVCALPAGNVQAQTVTENLTADLSGFIDISGNVASPVSAIDASFTVTFNPASYIGPTTSGLTVNSFGGLTLPSPIEYVWNPTIDVLTIYESPVSGEIFTGQTDVVFQFNLSNFSAPRLSVCTDQGFDCPGSSLLYTSGYTLASYSNDGWFATVANGVPATSVPEPAALTLLFAGLAMLTGRRQSQPRVAAKSR